MARLKSVFNFLKAAFKDWSDDKAPQLAAALAYYTIFSIAPLLIIIIAVVGFIWRGGGVQDTILTQVQQNVGPQAAEAVQGILDNAARPGAGIIGTVVGIATLILGASGFFSQLQNSLNRVWEVEVKPGAGILATIKRRGISFTMVLGIGFLLLVSLVLSAALSALSGWLEGVLPVDSPVVLQILNNVISLAVITLLFAVIYKVLPDVEITWRDVWVGAFITALLFTLGKFLLGLYLGQSSTASAYGAAGSLVVLLVWVYYSAQILLFGAEVTQRWAVVHDRQIKPAEYAQRIADAHKFTQEGRPAEQGEAGRAGERESMPAGQPPMLPRLSYPAVYATTHQPSLRHYLAIGGLAAVGFVLGRRLGGDS